MRSQVFYALLIALFAAPVAADDWPQWRGTTRDGRWRESGVITRFEAERIPRKWRQPIGSGYSGPTVAGGRVFVMDRVTDPEQAERVHCFDAESGDKLWTHEYRCPYVGIGYTAGPRASVAIDGERAYALGAMGHLHCLDAAGGQVLWKRDLNEEYQIRRESKDDDRMPIWGIAASPLIFNDLLILHIGGRDGACLVALDKTSGREVWRALDDRAQYSSPILVRQAGRDVLVAWTGDSVAGVDPRTGHVHWRFPFAPSQMPIGIATPIVKDDLLFVTSFYDGSLLLRLRQDALDVEPVWQARGPDEEQTEALHSIMSTPIWLGDYIYGVDSYGELRCLEAATGGRVWEDLTATTNIRWGTIHFVQNGEDTWMFNDRGELIIARLSPTGFQPLSRAKLLDPTTDQLPRRDGVCWSHPAFADGHVFARNDNELVCADLRQH